MENYLLPLFELFEQNADPVLAEQMAKYMAYQFEFYGIQRPQRQKLQAQFWKQYGIPAYSDLKQTLVNLWQHPKREPQYTALDLIDKYKKNLTPEFLDTLEYLIINKSWWDSVDILASKYVFAFFGLFPHLEKKTIERWLDSENLWLQRTCLIYQLRRKDQIDTEILSYVINRLRDSQEFFIQKAIGWILRELSKYRPEFVRDYVKKIDLPSLSKREALKYLRKKGK